MKELVVEEDDLTLLHIDGRHRHFSVILKRSKVPLLAHPAIRVGDTLPTSARLCAFPRHSPILQTRSLILAVSSKGLDRPVPLRKENALLRMTLHRQPAPCLLAHLLQSDIHGDVVARLKEDVPTKAIVMEAEIVVVLRPLEEDVMSGQEGDTPQMLFQPALQQGPQDHGNQLRGPVDRLLVDLGAR